MIWFGWVLCHINYCRLFNAKSSFDIYIKYIGFDLVGFLGYQPLQVCISYSANTFVKGMHAKMFSPDKKFDRIGS